MNTRLHVLSPSNFVPRILDRRKPHCRQSCQASTSALSIRSGPQGDTPCHSLAVHLIKKRSTKQAICLCTAVAQVTVETRTSFQAGKICSTVNCRATHLLTRAPYPSLAVLRKILQSYHPCCSRLKHSARHFVACPLKKTGLRSTWSSSVGNQSDRRAVKVIL